MCCKEVFSQSLFCQMFGFFEKYINFVERFDMALISCPECNKDVSDKASSCPGCGVSIRKDSMEERYVKRNKQENVAGWFYAILLVPIGIFCIWFISVFFLRL